MASTWNRLIGPAQRRFRRQRAKKIRAFLPGIQGARVIDIGGSLAFWHEVDEILKPARVLCYNISDNRMKMGREEDDPRIVARLYDGKRIPEEDQSADVVICNSVIEHVPQDQRANLAREVMRVGKAWVVQTPSPAFPLELHFGLPFIHWLPRSIGRQVVRVSPFHLLSNADGPTYFDETRLLARRELVDLFPGGRLIEERVLGIPKSQLMFGGEAYV
ncbi:MAG: class I SAM-dependent methyltransferase [Erythrobacter sp.]|uniref:class I SAM-dependent methyltransferase n=1 Tax=Erythrobacter sp. TaxID=1042 RepID=UPI0032EB64D3